MNISKNKWYSLFFFKGGMIYLLTLIVCLALAALLGLKTPELISSISRNYDSEDLYFASLMALLFNFLYVYVNRVIYGLLVNKYVRLLIQYARLETYSRWLSAKDLDSEKYPQGEVLSRIMSDTDSIRDLITSGAFGIFIDLCFVISCLIGFINLHQSTGFFIAIVEFLATVLLIWGSRLMRDMFMKLRNAQANVNRVTANVLGGFSQIYYTRHDHYASKKSIIAFDDFLEKQNTVNTMDAFYYALAESLYPVLLAFIIYILPITKLMEMALIFAIVDLVQRSINPIKEISGKIANIQRARTGIDRIQHFLDEFKGDEEFISFQSGLSFEKMTVDIPYFEFEKRKNKEGKIIESENREIFSLNNINFEGKKGELIGIVGLSGSGKSTLLNILSGNLFAKSANVQLMMNDQARTFEINLKQLEQYKREVSIVSQDSHIFSESLIFNITLTHEIPTDFYEKWNFILSNISYLKKWEHQLDKKITPHELSLGEKQLLASVRACYLQKNIVFFDEISSALDSELELALRRMILLIQQFSLTIIVAHRLETVISANKIIIMHNGRLVDSGTHTDLIVRSPEYKEFINELSHS